MRYYLIPRSLFIQVICRKNSLHQRHFKLHSHPHGLILLLHKLLDHLIQKAVLSLVRDTYSQIVNISNLRNLMIQTWMTLAKVKLRSFNQDIPPGTDLPETCGGNLH